jgi:hypothetical protein
VNIVGLEDFERRMAATPPAIMDKARVRAINRTATTVRAESVRQIRGQVALAAGYVRPRLRIINANRSRPSALIQTPTRGTLLTRSRYRELAKRRGINVTVKTGGTRNMKGAFLLPLKAGKRAAEAGTNVGIAIHRSGRSKGVWAYRRGNRTYYVQVLYGPSVSQVFETLQPALVGFARTKLRAELVAQIRFALTEIR